MRIINQTKNTLLAEQAVVADTFFKRTIGLLGRKELQKGEALVLRPCNSVHTFFMRFPLDLLFLDKNNKILKTISSIQPFRLTPIYFNAHFAIELPTGTIQDTSTAQNDTIVEFPQNFPLIF